jgi:hypothetical protein
MCTVPAYLSLSGAIFSLLFFHVFSRRIIRSNILSNVPLRTITRSHPVGLNSKDYPTHQQIVESPAMDYNSMRLW